MQPRNSENEGTKLSQFPKHQSTPFVPKIKEGTRPISSSKIGETYNTVSGELISDNVKIVVSKSIDKSEFVKMFVKSFKMFFDIDGTDIKLFLFLAKNLQMNTSKARFDMVECKKEIGCSRPSIYKALGQLCGKGFIARSDKTYYYWVNPSIAFNGSRLSIIKTEEID